MKKKVSVIIPAFGDFDTSRTRISIESVKAQRNADIEILISEHSEKPSLSDIKGVRYIHTFPRLSNDGFLFPGLVRNIAVANSDGDFVYNNDGDVVLGNPYYFENLLDLIEGDKNLCLCHPFMRRIALENFDDFKKRFNEGGIQKAISELDLSHPYGATYSDNFVRWRHFEKMVNGDLEIAVATQKDHKAYHAGENKGKEPFFYTLNIHVGGTLISRKQFEAIGGYCEDFAGWGCQDVDIQYKLGTLFNLKKIHKISNLEVFHLDHPRNYFTNLRWEKNKRLLDQRRGAIIEELIKSDRERCYGKRI